MKTRAAPFMENIFEAGAACLFTMVQGNLLALGLTHWVIASQTGIAAGLLASLAILLMRTRSRLMISGTLALVTALVDYVVHPGGFGPVMMEAVVTGLAAGLLSFAFGGLLAKVRSPATSTEQA